MQRYFVQNLCLLKYPEITVLKALQLFYSHDNNSNNQENKILLKIQCTLTFSLFLNVNKTLNYIK